MYFISVIFGKCSAIFHNVAISIHLEMYFIILLLYFEQYSNKLEFNKLSFSSDLSHHKVGGELYKKSGLKMTNHSSPIGDHVPEQ